MPGALTCWMLSCLCSEALTFMGSAAESGAKLRRLGACRYQQLSDNAKQLLLGMLAFDPSQRLRIHEASSCPAAQLIFAACHSITLRHDRLLLTQARIVHRTSRSSSQPFWQRRCCRRHGSSHRVGQSPSRWVRRLLVVLPTLQPCAGTLLHLLT